MKSRALNFGPGASLAERGYDKDWFRARAKHLKASPWCVMCLKSNVYTRAKHVDHIVTIRQRPDLRLDPRNFQSLCDRHHDLITASIDSGDLRGAVNVEGEPLDPRHPWAQATTEEMIDTVNRPFVREPAPPGVTALLKRQALGGGRRRR